MNRRSLLRDVIGFLAGALIGPTGGALVYLAFLGAPTGSHNGEDGAPLAALTLFLFFAGGFVGSKGFTADFVSDLYPSIIGSLTVAVLLCVIASVSLGELCAMIGFAAAGLMLSAFSSLLLLRCFPPKITDE